MSGRAGLQSLAGVLTLTAAAASVLYLKVVPWLPTSSFLLLLSIRGDHKLLSAVITAVHCGPAEGSQPVLVHHVTLSGGTSDMGSGPASRSRHFTKVEKKLPKNIRSRGKQTAGLKQSICVLRDNSCRNDNFHHDAADLVYENDHVVWLLYKNLSHLNQVMNLRKGIAVIQQIKNVELM